MTSPLEQPWARVNAFIWDDDLRSMPGPRRLAFRFLRILYVVIRELLRGDLNLRAMSLVYTTLLSLVPLLAVSFSVLKVFRVHQHVQPLLLRFVEPLGPKGEELAEKFIAFVEGVDVGVLGAVGTLLLIYTVITLAKKIEDALNFVWRVGSSRSFGQRFGPYAGFLLVGPLCIIAATGITASVTSTALVRNLARFEPFGTLVVWSSKLTPYLLVWVAFVFIYRFVPNTRVKNRVAVLGGLVAGVMWQSTGWLFAAFIVSSARYAAIYSSFAILILALIWLYLNWVILLIGAQIAFLVQNPRYLTMRPVRLDLSNRLKERLALTIMYLVGYNHHFHVRPWTLESLVDRLEFPGGPVHSLLNLLKEQGYLEQTADDPPAYLPARSLETIELRDLIDSVRRAEESHFLREEGLLAVEPVDDLFGRLRETLSRTLSGHTVRDLVVTGPAPSVEEPEA